MYRLSPEQAQALLTEQQAKMSRGKYGLSPDVPDEGLESVLSNKIRQYCEKMGYPCLIFRQSKQVKGLVPAGWPDCSIALPGGRTVWIELKNKAGRLSDEQKMYKLMFMALGHEWYEVRSYKRFLEIVEGM